MKPYTPRDVWLLSAFSYERAVARYGPDPSTVGGGRIVVQPSSTGHPQLVWWNTDSIRCHAPVPEWKGLYLVHIPSTLLCPPVDGSELYLLTDETAYLRLMKELRDYDRAGDRILKMCLAMMPDFQSSHEKDHAC